MWNVATRTSKTSPAGVVGETDIVINGFEKGMADSAEEGIQLIKNANIITASKELAVNFKMASVTIPPTVSAVNCTFTGATDIVTSSGAIGSGIYNGCAVYFGNTAGGVTANVPYWVGNISGNDFKVYDHVSRLGSAVDLTDTSNTISTYTLGAMTHHAESWATNTSSSPAFSPQNFFIDSNGRTWWANSTLSALIFLGNTTLTNANGNGLTCIGGSAGGPGFLLVFRQSTTDYITLDVLTSTSATSSLWTYGWQAVTGYANVSHQAIESKTFNGVIFCNGTTVGTIRLGTSTFDPATAATYDFDTSSLLLPTQDRANYIAELNNQFLIGGVQSTIYTWGGVVDEYNFLNVPEPNIQKIIAVNSNAYVFAGNRGRIYVTNGSNVELYRKFPDQIAGVPEPYWVWGGALYWRNQLYFALQSYQNNGTAILNTGGVWAIDLDTKALRHTNDVFLGSSASCPVIAPNVSSTLPGGAGLYASSTNSGNTAWQLDVSSTSPYTDGSTVIRTDLIPVGTFYTGRSFTQVEYKLSRPLVSGESVAIGWRNTLTGAFTSLVSDSTQVGSMSGTFVSNIDPSQYLQIEVALTSTASTPSYCRLTEIRIR